MQGDLEMLHQSGGDLAVSSTGCLGSALTGLSLPIPEIPLPGQGLYFIVREEEESVQGTWDEGDIGQIRSRDPALQNASGSCP